MGWQKHKVLLETATENVIRYGRRSGVVLLCLVVSLAPLVMAMAISEAIKEQAKISVEMGPDVIVTNDFGGRSAPIPLEYVEKIKEMEWVRGVYPRVVGRVYLDSTLVIIVGIPPEALPFYADEVVDGRAFRPGEEGVALVCPWLVERYRELFGVELNPGDKFFLDDWSGRAWVFTVVGIFRSERVTIWNYDLVIIPFEDAQDFFGLKQENTASDLLVNVVPGYEAPVYGALKMINPFLRIQDKSLIESYVKGGLTQRQGVFSLFYLIILILAIPLVSILSVFGLTERRREAGILKASGWQTMEVMEVSIFETLILGVTGAIIAVLAAIIWVKVFNGFLIASLFISGLGLYPAFPVPAIFSPMFIALSVFLGVIIVTIGTLYSTWRSAITPPAETMRP